MVTVPEIPVGKVDTYKGHYHGIYVYLHFKNRNGVNKNDYQIEKYSDIDEEDMEDIVLDEKREIHWRMIFGKHEVAGDDYKALLYAKRWYLYMSKK